MLADFDNIQTVNLIKFWHIRFPFLAHTQQRA
jgi:hypothetical protein